MNIAVRAFSIELATTRDVYLDGESFRVEATTRDPQGEPTGQEVVAVASEDHVGVIHVLLPGHPGRLDELVVGVVVVVAEVDVRTARAGDDRRRGRGREGGEERDCGTGECEAKGCSGHVRPLMGRGRDAVR